MQPSATSRGGMKMFFRALEDRWGRFACNKLSPVEMGLTMKAPPHLAAETRKWFTEVVTTYQLEPHHFRLFSLPPRLGTAARKRGEQLPATASSALTTGRAHPAVAIERDSRLAFARLLRELDLDTEPPPSWSRPPALHSNRRNLRGGIGIKLDD